MKLTITTSMGSYKEEVKNHKDLVDLIIMLEKLSGEDNDWEEK